MGNSSTAAVKSYAMESHANMKATASDVYQNRHGYFSDWWESVKSYYEAANGHALTVEKLKHEVETMKPADLEHMLHQGMNVNAVVDQQGHTILDVFAEVHKKMLEDSLTLKGVSQEEKTAIFMQQQIKAFHMMDVLKSHGAVLSSPFTQARALHK
mmetsp:Transcript_140736/g.262646  ORF Transcript_140736/g.262646 Transcript_140736/m.262646 type:complete len:156 (+) Transcript_140736:110-577(+)